MILYILVCYFLLIFPFASFRFFAGNRSCVVMAHKLNGTHRCEWSEVKEKQKSKVMILVVCTWNVVSRPINARVCVGMWGDCCLGVRGCVCANDSMLRSKCCLSIFVFWGQSFSFHFVVAWLEFELFVWIFGWNAERERNVRVVKWKCCDRDRDGEQRKRKKLMENVCAY